MKPLATILTVSLLVVATLIAIELLGDPGPRDLSYEGRQFTSDFAYDQVCGGGWGGGVLIDFDPSWDDIVSDWIPENTESIWEIPGGFVGSTKPDSVSPDSITVRFRLAEGRVDPWSCPRSPNE